MTIRDKLERIRPDVEAPETMKIIDGVMHSKKDKGAKMFDKAGLGNILGQIVHEKKLKKLPEEDLEAINQLSHDHHVQNKLVKEVLNFLD